MAVCPRRRLVHSGDLHMFARIARIAPVGVLFVLCVGYANIITSQEIQPPRVDPAPAEIPKGVEVQARGPVHEAFATPMTEAAPMPLLAKKPPLPIEEMPPEEKPDGNVVWIGGYYAWDD